MGCETLAVGYALAHHASYLYKLLGAIRDKFSLYRDPIALSPFVSE